MVCKLSKHAQQRVRQRGMKEDDVDFVMRHGTETPDGILMTRKDAAAIEREAKRMIATAHRLVGRRLVIDGNQVITVMKATRELERQLLSNAG